MPGAATIRMELWVLDLAGGRIGGNGGTASVGGIPLKPLGRHPDPSLQGKAPLVTWCCHPDTCLLSTYYASDSALAPDETETDEV